MPDDSPALHEPVAGRMPAQPGASQRSARRQRLREFQVRLSQRLEEARSEQEAPARQLGVLIATHWCLLDLQEAGEVLPAHDITPVPWTRPWFLGLTKLRGHLLAVLDGAALLGAAPTEIDRNCRVIALAPALGLQCGLLVSRVSGLHDQASLHAAGLRVPPSLQAWSETCHADDQGRHWTALSLARLVQDPRFWQAGLPETDRQFRFPAEAPSGATASL